MSIPRLAHNGLVGGSSPPGPTTHSRNCGDFLKACEMPRFGGDLVLPLGLRDPDLWFWRPMGAFFSALEIPFPGNGDHCSAETRFEWELLRRKPEHLVLAGPFGRQVGEADNSHAMRKASFDRSLDEIGREEGKRDVMLTLRTLQPSRVAMLVVFAVGSAVSSLSQRRPRAIEAIRRARFSERIARASCGLADLGTSISRRRLSGLLCQGTLNTLRLRDRLEPIASASSITN